MHRCCPPSGSSEPLAGQEGTEAPAGTEEAAAALVGSAAALAGWEESVGVTEEMRLRICMNSHY